MSKFMKLAIVILVLGVSVVLVRNGMNKSGDSSVTTTEPDGQIADPTKEASGSSPGKNGSVTGMNGANGDGGVSETSNGESGAGSTGSDGEHKAPLDPKMSTNAEGKEVPILAKIVDGKVVSTDIAPQNVPAKEPGKPDNNCFSFEYKNTREALNKDIEDFLDYSNAFPLIHDQVSQKSVCVKVNGKPTAFKLSKYKNQSEVVIGSVVGPDSIIKLSYCVGPATCKEACAIKSNRFMDDLMSDAGDEDEFKESWGEAKEQKKELQAKVKELRSVASENKDLQKQATIRTWDTIDQKEWFCKKEK